VQAHWMLVALALVGSALVQDLGEGAKALVPGGALTSDEWQIHS